MLHKPVQWFWMGVSGVSVLALAYGISVNAHHQVMVQWLEQIWPSVYLAVPLVVAALLGMLAAWAWMQATVVEHRHETRQAEKASGKAKLAHEDVERELAQAQQTIATLEAALDKALSSPAESTAGGRQDSGAENSDVAG